MLLSMSVFTVEAQRNGGNGGGDRNDRPPQDDQQRPPQNNDNTNPQPQPAPPPPEENTDNPPETNNTQENNQNNTNEADTTVETTAVTQPSIGSFFLPLVQQNIKNAIIAQLNDSSDEEILALTETDIIRFVRQRFYALTNQHLTEATFEEKQLFINRHIDPINTNALELLTAKQASIRAQQQTEETVEAVIETPSTEEATPLPQPVITTPENTENINNTEENSEDENTEDTTEETEPENEGSNMSQWMRFHAFDIAKIAVPIMTVGVGYFFTRRRKKKFRKYLKLSDKMYKNYRQKRKRLEAELYRLKDIVSEDLTRGKIDEAAYQIIERRIDEYLKEAEELELNERFGTMPEHMQEQLAIMLEDGKLTKEEYNKMKGLIKNASSLSESEKNDLGDALTELKKKKS